MYRGVFDVVSTKANALFSAKTHEERERDIFLPDHSSTCTISTQCSPPLKLRIKKLYTHSYTTYVHLEFMYSSTHTHTQEVESTKKRNKSPEPCRRYEVSTIGIFRGVIMQVREGSNYHFKNVNQESDSRWQRILYLT